MTKKAEPAVMWAITFPMRGGKPALSDHVFKERSDAILWLTGWSPGVEWSWESEWRACRRAGYRCVKVRVTEI